MKMKSVLSKVGSCRLTLSFNKSADITCDPHYEEESAVTGRNPSRKLFRDSIQAAKIVTISREFRLNPLDLMNASISMSVFLGAHYP